MSKKRPAGRREESARFAGALSCLREIYGTLTEENRALRADPSRPAPGDPATRQQLEHKVARLEHENSDLAVRLDSADAGQQSGTQEDLLANLYVAGHHLHRARDLQAVLDSVKEILLNLVGAEAFAIYLLGRDGATLTQVADQHGGKPAARSIPLGEGIMGVVAKTGISYFDGERQAGDFHNPVACVPLKAEEQLLGVIQIHRLFSQKKNLTPQDHEIFTLLAETAGTAMVSAMLRRRYLNQGSGQAVKLGELLQEAGTISDGPAEPGPQAGGGAPDVERSRA
jgi:transcriptional regulator with GAF, ATPase, and Fis domain